MDRRSSSRVVELLDCSFTYGDESHSAVIVDLSQNGAMLSSRCRVPIGDIIGINIPLEDVKKKLTVNGKVMRSTRVATDHGLRYRSVVQFGHTPLDLVILVAKLNAKYV